MNLRLSGLSSSYTFGIRRLERHSLINVKLSRNNGHLTGSAKLLADAAREEAEERSEPARPTVDAASLVASKHANWTGDESIHDTVLRMLVDKYKPLRSGTVRSADEKLKDAPPQPMSIPTPKECASEPLLPSVEGHRPWHTTFRPPSTQTASIRFGDFSTIRPRIPKSPGENDDPTWASKQSKKKRDAVERLVKARESTLDYRLGVQSSSVNRGRANPVTLKGWTNMIEDKIERARNAGFFNTIQGRGKPLVRHPDEGNPFVAREEFLLNRIVQRNGAIPPWIEVQHELESELKSFREIIRQSWTRRVIRTLTLHHPPALLGTLTLSDIKSHRDKEWEEREKSFHEVVLADINGLMRKYNALAPYVARRPYHILHVELERVFHESAHDILQTLAERTQFSFRPPQQRDPSDTTDAHEISPDRPFSILEAIRRWWVPRAFAIGLMPRGDLEAHLRCSTGMLLFDGSAGTEVMV